MYRGLAVVGIALALAACASGRPRDIADIAAARALSDRALEQLDGGDAAGAVASLDKVIASGSADERDYARRGAAYGRLRNYAPALKDTDRSLALAPDQWRIHLQRAFLNQKLGRFDVAVRDLEKATALKPDEPELARRSGYLNIVAGRFDAAHAAYARLEQLQPSSTTAATGRGVAKYLAGDWRGAANEFARVLEVEPGDGVAALWLAKASLRAPLPLIWEAFVSASGPGPEWTLIKLLIADTTVEEVERAVAELSQPGAGRPAVLACEQSLYLGEWRIIRARGTGARRAFDAARHQCPADSIEAAQARAELARLP